MRVAVTGASGFIGRHVVGELLRRGHSVVASSFAAAEAADLPWFAKVRFEELDIHAEVHDPYERLGRPDIVIHLAWKGLPNYQQLFHLEENLFHQYRYLRQLVADGLPQLVVAGTCLEYGLQNGCLSEEMATAPVTPYSLAKDVLHRMLQQLNRQHAFVLQWLRLFYVYGEGQHPNSLLSQLARAIQHGERDFPMSGGEQLRDFVPVRFASEAIVKVAEQTNIIGAINCCSGRAVSVRTFVERHLESLGASIQLKLGTYPYPEYEPMAFWGSTGKLRQAMGEPRG